VGPLLRNLSLDELPQLINILKGEMSIIGPRPTLPEHLDRYTDEQKRRLDMRPGVTGLAQVNGRNMLKWSARIEYDVQYIDTFSLWNDFKILLKTAKVVVLRQGIAKDRNPEQVDDLAAPRR
jgi:lipopolysaccharide/colanic/teichoic acid biosynthesis glycosyltransferase